jgi:hypothetical protein
MNARLLPSLALASVLSAQQPPPPIPAVPLSPVAVPAIAQPIDLAICLDISGSMEGLLNTTRQNLWAVVNQLATLQPAPTLRVALLTFGCLAHDPERGWVKVETGFTSDLDAVSQRLFALSTNGGDEYVARVMQAALEELHWSPEPQALRILFVAGNEAATQDPKVEAAAMSRAAIARGIVVNAIYCGSPTDDLAPAWRELAQLADGQFAAIEKDSGIVITTPFDEELARLSAALNDTYVPYGPDRAQWVANQTAQDCNATGLNPAAAALRCVTKGSALYQNAHWDLVDACADAKFDLGKLKQEDLPEALRALTVDGLRAHIAEKRQQRDQIRGRIEALGRQREAFVAAELRRLGEQADRLFDKVVLEAVLQQAEAKGFARRQPAAATASFEATIAAAARDYRSFALVSGEMRLAPTDCRAPEPLVRRSAAEREHGQKLYQLYARFADGENYVVEGVAAAVGQTLVKEAWVCVDGPPRTATEATARYGRTPRLLVDGKVFHAGDAAGLFVMHKLAPDTPGTDQGWIYGTVDRHGVVTAAGAVASCMRCHEGAAEDRRFGLR